MNDLVPLRTKQSPSSTAFVLKLAASEPGQNEVQDRRFTKLKTLVTVRRFCEAIRRAMLH